MRHVRSPGLALSALGARESAIDGRKALLSAEARKLCLPSTAIGLCWSSLQVTDRQRSSLFLTHHYRYATGRSGDAS